MCVCHVMCGILLNLDGLAIQSDSSELSLNNFLRFEHRLDDEDTSNVLFGDAHSPLTFELLLWLRPFAGTPNKLLRE